MTRSSICLATATVASLTLTQLSPAAASSLVSQGDRVQVAERGHCTISFNDPAQQVSYTAGHCGKSGERAVSGEATGTFYPSQEYGKSLTGNDWGLIRWDDGVELGPNRFSGDTVVELSQVKVGDRVCSYGSATQAVACGPYSGRLANNVYWDTLSGKPGDSGGPVWVDGKGYLAVYSGTSTISNGSGTKAGLMRASAPLNGPGVSEAEEIEFIGKIKKLPEPTRHNTNTPTVRGNETEKSSAAGTIALVVVILLGAIVASLPTIVQEFPGLLPLLPI